MNSVSELNWLQAWYLLWCDGDWEHSYGVTIESDREIGWILKADLTDTALEGQPLSPGKHPRSESDWVAWQPEGSVFCISGGLWNLTEMVGLFRDWVQGLEIDPRAGQSVSRFLTETDQINLGEFRELPWLESWHRSRVLQHQQAHVKIQTLDNPGWGLEAELAFVSDPVLKAARALLPKGARGWMDWKVEDTRLISYAGPENLVVQVETLRSLIRPPVLT